MRESVLKGVNVDATLMSANSGRQMLLYRGHLK
jgi:hypothetical protein